MYNRIFKAEYLLSEAGCSIETVAFLEIALKFFEKAKLPATETYLSGERKFKLEDIVNEVFATYSNNRFAGIKFPDSYMNDSELMDNLHEMFFDDKFGVSGKTFDELVTLHSKSWHPPIQSMKNLFEILVEGMVIVLSKPPYNFRCYYKNIDGNPYFIVGSWANPETTY